MNIPEQVVEKAAVVVKESIEASAGLHWCNPDQEYWDQRDGGLHTGVEGLVECQSVARATISVVAPMIAAHALRDAADAIPEAFFVQFGGEEVDLNKDQRTYLRARADQLEAS